MLSSLKNSGQLVVMTGAGISAESGIPTFRGDDGFWTFGSKEYTPQELATYSTFAREPEWVWAFYLYRIVKFRDAKPNSGHAAVVKMEQLLGDRFKLITQNIDGLHLDAGNTLERTYQIHGNIRWLRCADGCGQTRWPFPLAALDAATTQQDRARDTPLSAVERKLLECPACNGWARPYVLWFDEYYDEDRYRFDSSIRAARMANILLVVGTSGATNLPMQVAHLAASEGCHIIEVNPERTAFTELVEEAGGTLLTGTASEHLPRLAATLE